MDLDQPVTRSVCRQFAVQCLALAANVIRDSDDLNDLALVDAVLAAIGAHQHGQAQRHLETIRSAVNADLVGRRLAQAWMIPSDN